MGAWCPRVAFVCLSVATKDSRSLSGDRLAFPIHDQVVRANADGIARDGQHCAGFLPFPYLRLRPFSHIQCSQFSPFEALYGAMRPCLRFSVSSSLHPFISTFEVFSLVRFKQPVDSALISLFLILGFLQTQARTKCDFDKKPAEGELACQTGGCVEGLICQSLYTGAPASVAEFSFTDEWDFYDCSSIRVPQSSKLRWLTASKPTTVSMIDGYNVNVRSKYHCPMIGVVLIIAIKSLQALQVTEHDVRLQSV